MGGPRCAALQLRNGRVVTDGKLSRVSAARSVLIIGTGLLGASLGLGLRALGRDVLLEDPSPTARALARDLGAGREAVPNEPEPSLVLVACPPDVVADVICAALHRFPTAVVSDVASVKAEPARVVAERGGDLRRYVGGHPMAGRERSGPVAARGDLFVGRPWVLTPTPATDPTAVALVRSVAIDLSAVPVVMTAEEHDSAVARVSHVPQLAASLVAARLLDADDQAVSLAGQGVRDVTRIAGSDPALWVQILAGNPALVAEVLRAVRTDLDRVLAALEKLAGDGDALGARGDLAKVLDAGVRGHARIPGKHGGSQTALAAVTVQVPDRPGEIMKILQAMSAAEINLEDLRIEHVPGRLVGLAEISVLPGVRDAFEKVLLEGGWTLAG